MENLEIQIVPTIEARIAKLKELSKEDIIKLVKEVESRLDSLSKCESESDYKTSRLENSEDYQDILNILNSNKKLEGDNLKKVGEYFNSVLAEIDSLEVSGF